MAISISKVKRIGITPAAITEERGFASFGQSPFCHPDPFGSAQGRLRGGVARRLWRAGENRCIAGAPD
jgi:hypothetical protein